MTKCEVLGRAVLTIEKGSVVYVTERQYELARNLLKPVNEDEPKQESVEVVEVRTEKKTRKKK